MPALPEWPTLERVKESPRTVNKDVQTRHQDARPAHTTFINVVSVLPSGTGPHQDWYERKSTFLFISSQFFMSVVTHLDLATNALFLAKVLATNNCRQKALHDIEHFWHRVWETSLWHIAPPKFSRCVLLVWVVLFGQVFYSMVCYLSVRERRCTSAAGLKALFGTGPFYEVRDRGMIRTVFHTYSTLWMRSTQHGSVLMTLAESARMYTICSDTWSEKEEMVKRGLRMSSHVYEDILASITSFLLYRLFENIAQIELQSTALEFGRAMTEGHNVDTETLISLALSFFMAVVNLHSACSKMLRQVRSCLNARISDPQIGECVRITGIEGYNWRAQKCYLPIAVVVFSLLVLAYATLLLHAFVKTVMVVFYCPCGWNITFHLDMREGCVRSC